MIQLMSDKTLLFKYDQCSGNNPKKSDIVMVGCNTNQKNVKMLPEEANKHSR